MAQQSFSPSSSPFVTPNLLAQQLRMQQTANWGQGMLEQGQQTPQGQMVSGHYVAPSPLQYAAQLLKTSAGRNAVDSLPGMYGQIQQGQQNQARSMFGLGPIGQAPAQTGPSAPQGDVQAFPVGPSGTPQQPPVAGVQPSPQALAAGLQPQVPQMPLLPGKTPQESYTAFTVMGPVEYMKAVASQGAPTDVQKNLIAGGLRPGTPEWNQAMNAVNTKAGYIAPVNVRPGSTVLDPRTNQPIFGAPDNGMQVHYDANGNAYTTQVPGWNDAVSANAQSKAAGTEAGKKIGQMRGSIESGERKLQAIKEGSSMAASFSSLDRLKQTTDAILNSKGFNGISGFSADVLKSYVPGTAQADTIAQLNTLKSEIAQNVLQMYRDMSKTGGAVGQVTENEQKMFMNNLAALSRAQSPEQMRSSLTRIVNFVDQSEGRLRTAYDAQYGKGAFESYMGGNLTMDNNPVSPVPAVKPVPGNEGSGSIPTFSQAQYQAAPSGTLFTAPDGSLRRKP